MPARGLARILCRTTQGTSDARRSIQQPQSLVNGIRPIGKVPTVIALASDLSRQRAPKVPIRAQAFQYMRKIVFWFPAQTRPRELIDVNPIDLREELPPAGRVERLALGKESMHNLRSIPAQHGQITRRKGSGRRDDVAGKADASSSFDCQEYRGDDVFDGPSPIWQLVFLGVGGLVLLT